ncbi:MAG: hypothetical protein E6J43_12325 [Chloroflexi bacterium]|nr:MAG: hypothetical protein E6J43_12325 [Chloroflexota bacterium]
MASSLSFTKIAVALLLVSLALVEARTADASSSLTTETTKEASATFDSESDGIRNSVEVVVSETAITSPEGTKRGLHANIEVLQAGSRGGDIRTIDLAGGVDTQPGGFDLSEDLSGASLHITVPVCGAKVLHNGRLKQRAFDDCFDVQVDLQWTGSGEIASESGADEYQAGDCTVQVASAYRRRTSSATGTISAGATNFSPGDSLTSLIGTSSRSTAVTCPD